MRILLDGYTGFIGAHCVRSLVKSNYQVTLMGKSKPKLSGVDWIRLDLQEFSHETYSTLRSVRADVFIHLAWHGLPKRTRAELIVNDRIFNNVVKYMPAIDAERNIFFGSSLEYASSTTPLTTDAVTDCSPFAVTKLTMKAIFENTFSRPCWIRPFFVYGPGQHSNSLLNSAYMKFKKGDYFYPLNPDTVNDFVHVSDVSSTLIKIIEASKLTGTINVGTGIPTKNCQVIEVLRDLMQLNQQPPPPKTSNQKPETRIACINEISERLNWVPTIKLKSGILEFLVNKGDHKNDSIEEESFG